ncbi:hypothetical protein [Candidatus Avelusimicrobium fimicolum]|uniref:hypothetical protein n=1 Tax=Candidatus Avelusimicrobium fimicolum TaxID=3416216 RepID=UPI003D14D577
MEDNELFLRFFCGLLILMTIGAFTIGISARIQEHEERMLAIQKCPCMEIKK